MRIPVMFPATNQRWSDIWRPRLERCDDERTRSPPSPADCARCADRSSRWANRAGAGSVRCSGPGGRRVRHDPSPGCITRLHWPCRTDRRAWPRCRAVCWRGGLLLAQVSTEWGWDRLAFLEHTWQKAGLARGAWQHDATIWKFEAEVFGESEDSCLEDLA